MPKHTPSWMTSDNKIHSNYSESLRHELMLWFKKVGDNEVGARKISEALDVKSIDFLLENLNILKAELISPTRFAVVNISYETTETIESQVPTDQRLVLVSSNEDPVEVVNQ